MGGLKPGARNSRWISVDSVFIILNSQINSQDINLPVSEANEGTQEWPLRVGSTVRFKNGPFAGQAGIINELGPDDRAKVGLHLAGEMIVVRCRVQDLQI